MKTLARIGCAVAVLACCGISGSAAGEPDSTVVIDVKSQGAVISPLLFSHNLEVTRRAVWSGLGAEMVANRKFAAVTGDMPKRWQALTGSGVVKVDKTVAYVGKQAMRVEVAVQGQAAGLTQQQEMLSVCKGGQYGFRVWLKTEKDRKVKVLLAGKGGKPVAERLMPAKAGDWQLIEGKFVSADTHLNCTLEISSADVGTYWIGVVSLMPTDNFHGMRRDVIALLKQIKPGALRFPGGCYEEFYRWEEGLLPVDKRPPIGPTGLNFLLPHTDDYDTHEIGIDEFMALCREVGAQPAISLRLSESTSTTAAAWVEYCNGGKDTKWGKIRAERGHKKPYAVKTWFLGNELFYFGRSGMNIPNPCAMQTKRVAEAVKKVDPSVELVGCTDLSGGKINMAWNAPMLEHAGGLLSYLSCHDYLRDSAQPKGLSACAAVGVTHLRPMFQGIQKELNRAVVYDEWNTRWGEPGDVEMAFCVASVLNLLSREGDSLGVKQAHYFQPVTEGAIRVTPLAAELDTAGHVFDLFKVHQGNRVLNLSCSAPVDLCASLSPDSRRVYVTVVNGSGTEQSLTFRPAEGTRFKKSVANFRCLVPRTLKRGENELGIKEEKPGLKDGGITIVLPGYSIALLTLGG